MERQLTLITTNPSWRLDEETKEIGRRGIARVRAVLAANRPGPRDTDTDAVADTERTGPSHPDAA